MNKDVRKKEEWTVVAPKPKPKKLYKMVRSGTRYPYPRNGERVIDNPKDEELYRGHPGSWKWDCADNYGDHPFGSDWSKLYLTPVCGRYVCKVCIDDHQKFFFTKNGRKLCVTCEE